MEKLFLLKQRQIICFNNRLFSSTKHRSLISRFRYVLHNYWLATKLFYQNYKYVQQIRKKDINSLTRTETLTLEQHHYDIRAGIPFVFLLSLPVIGYSAPLLALIEPRYLPSTFILPKQKLQFLEHDARSSSSIIDHLNEFCQRHYDYESILDLISIMQFIKQLPTTPDRFKLLMSSVDSCAPLFNRHINLSSIDRKHLFILHKSVLHSSFMAKHCLNNYSMEKQLEMWQYRTSIDDKRIQNVDILNHYDLVKSLYARGLYLHVKEMGEVLQNEQRNNLNKMEKKPSYEDIIIDETILQDWKQVLSQWILIHRKISQSNRPSTSLLLHISPLLTNQ